MRPFGTATRGTTAPNRLRRVDRWIVSTYGTLLRSAEQPVVVDLGFGRSPVTTLELSARLRAVAPDVRVIGLEIDPARVADAHAAHGHTAGVEFRVGGFELGGLRPVLVRAMNVLRQYDETGVAPAWAAMQAALAPDGAIVEGTCDEFGRLGAWFAIGHGGPTTLTLSLRPQAVDRPSDVAARLPKSLISRNVPGQPIHRLLAALDGAWAASAPYAPFGAGQRWTQTVAALVERGWPVIGPARRWRMGELTVRWPLPPLPPLPTA